MELHMHDNDTLERMLPIFPHNLPMHKPAVCMCVLCEVVFRHLSSRQLRPQQLFCSARTEEGGQKKKKQQKITLNVERNRRTLWQSQHYHIKWTFIARDILHQLHFCLVAKWLTDFIYDWRGCYTRDVSIVLHIHITFVGTKR